MIIFGKDCKTLMASFFNRKKIYLPSDLCNLTVKKLRASKIKFDFYEVKRNFKTKDEYYFPKHDIDGVYVISDLFNFRKINYKLIRNKRVFLDLAHCSLETAKWHIKHIDNRNIVAICISFAGGKYYNFNGGGIIFDCKSINKIKIKRQKKILEKIPTKVLLKGIYNKHSTRIILEQKTFKDIEIDKLRKKGHHISDGLYINSTNSYENRRYFWKNCT